MIGGTYEFLMTSLPTLSFHHTEEAKHRVLTLLQKYAGHNGPSLSPVTILDSEARKFLPEKTSQLFEKIHLLNIHEIEFQHSKIKALAAFAKFSFELKNEIKKLRIAAVGNEIKGQKNWAEQYIGNGTPLEKEIRLLKYQWDKLESISLGHVADLEALFSYKIKLLLLLRRWSFNMEKGYENFVRLTSHAQQNTIHHINH